MFEEGDGPQEMPEPMRRAAARAAERMQRKPVAPSLAIEMPEDSSWWDYRSPYTDEDLDNWYTLLCDAFGTRLFGVADTFISQLASLCPTDWCPDKRKWKPIEDTLRTAIAIVASVKPRNELEASLAAQLVAVHFAAMKLGADIAKRSYADPRTVSALAATVKASAAVSDSLNRRRGKGASVKQSIKVEKHIHHHQHVHVETGRGHGETGGQSDATGIAAPEITDAGGVEKCTALPSENPRGSVLRIRSGQK